MFIVCLILGILMIIGGLIALFWGIYRAGYLRQTEIAVFGAFVLICFSIVPFYIAGFSYKRPYVVEKISIRTIETIIDKESHTEMTYLVTLVNKEKGEKIVCKVNADQLESFKENTEMELSAFDISSLTDGIESRSRIYKEGG